MPKRQPDDIVNIKVRCIEALRARLEKGAKRNQRSLNGEIVYRLGASFGAEGPALAAQFEEAEEEMKRKFSSNFFLFLQNEKKFVRFNGILIDLFFIQLKSKQKTLPFNRKS